MSTNLHVMGNRIRTARQFRKLTAEQLSEQLGIATESLRHIENGTRRPSYALLDNISDILDVPWITSPVKLNFPSSAEYAGNLRIWA